MMVSLLYLNLCTGYTVAVKTKVKKGIIIGTVVTQVADMMVVEMTVLDREIIVAIVSIETVAVGMEKVVVYTKAVAVDVKK